MPAWTEETQIYSLHLSIHDKRKGGKAGACPVNAVREGEKGASLSTAGVKRIGGGHNQTVVPGLELWKFIDFTQERSEGPRPSAQATTGIWKVTQQFQA